MHFYDYDYEIFDFYDELIHFISLMHFLVVSVYFMWLVIIVYYMW